MTRALCESFVRLRDEADAWCAGRSWAVRLPLLAWFAYILVRHWADADYHMAIPLLSPFGGDVRHDCRRRYDRARHRGGRPDRPGAWTFRRLTRLKE